MSVGQVISSVAEKFAPGDGEFKKVLHAIALAESGGNPNAVGDNGHSIGLFQNNMQGGRGAGYTKQQLSDPAFNAQLAASELFKYYQKGVQNGLTGADLVAYVSRTGQRPAAGNEWNAAKNYGRTVDSDSSLATNEPQMQDKSVLGKKSIPTEEEYYRTVKKQNPDADPYTVIETYRKATGKAMPPRPATQAKKFPFVAPIPEDMVKYNPFGKAMEDNSQGSLMDRLIPQAYASDQNMSKSHVKDLQRKYTKQYEVKPNDTLWGIAQKQLGSGDQWKELGYTGNPNKMPVGTKINIPQFSQQQPNTSTASGPQYSAPPAMPKVPTPQFAAKVVREATPNLSAMKPYTPAPAPKIPGIMPALQTPRAVQKPMPKPQPTVFQNVMGALRNVFG